MDFIRNERDSNMNVYYIFFTDLVFPYHAGKGLYFFVDKINEIVRQS